VTRLTARSLFRRLARVALVASAAGLVLPLVSASAASAATELNGAGSSFAGPEIQQWIQDTGGPPYNLAINYTQSNSGDGRLEFAEKTIDFGVTDIEYQCQTCDTKQPTFPFIYVPVTAGGLAFMYHLNGLSKTLQLSSYSACAIFTGAVTYWDDQVIKNDNPGVSFPHVAIHPVTRSDAAGTNYVMEEWCIKEQPALWKNFYQADENYPGQFQDFSATTPYSHWPLFSNAVPTDQGSADAAGTVATANNDGYITAVETAYALEKHFPVASVKNASGVYTQPTAVNVASALAYATQQSNGTHQLDFGGLGPHVYNPSTYSYLITPAQGWDATKGKVMSEYVNYALTLGQQRAPTIGYASLGLSLEQFGVDAMKANVPGWVPPTSAEQAAYSCGDFTPAEVQAGATAPSCGVTNPASAAASGSIAHTTVGAGPGATAGAGGTGGPRGTGGASGGSGALASADPSVSLNGGTSMAFTGGNPAPLLAGGATLTLIAIVARRRLLARRPQGAQQ
jgi:ABC-type phosphate transport system substrate-binding protein